MAYVATNNATFARPSGIDTTRIFKAFAEWRLYRRTLAELGALTDHELADLGLSRFQLPAVAREAIYGA